MQLRNTVLALTLIFAAAAPGAGYAQTSSRDTKGKQEATAQITSPLAAKKKLDPILKAIATARQELRKGNDSRSVRQRFKRASENLYAAQNQLLNLCGKGSEGEIKFTVVMGCGCLLMTSLENILG